jgi:plasmid stabilization system protein ParE
MDYKIVWTEPALNSLRDILSYIAQDNPLAARRLGDHHDGNHA